MLGHHGAARLSRSPRLTEPSLRAKNARVSSITRATKSQQRLSQEMVSKRLKHPEWFHVFAQDGEVKVNVQMARLPAPDRSIVADWAGAARNGMTIAMVFGQIPPGAAKMTGALVVQVAATRVREILLQAVFLNSVATYASTNGIVPEKRIPRPDAYPMERIVTERAQLIGVALGEDEAELRFYRASRSDFNAVAQEIDVDLVYPVIEVRMSAEEFVHLSHTLEDVTADAPRPELGKGRA